MTSINNSSEINYVAEEDVKRVLENSELCNENFQIEDYIVNNASNKMLGFLCDYWRLQVVLSTKDGKKFLSFFIKAISRSNTAKANMVKELNLYQKELVFYSIIKKALEVEGIKPWSATLITSLDDAMVFQDLNAAQYKLRNKFERFDKAHTLQALSTLSRFHASSIIFETKKRKELQRLYTINEQYGQYLDEGGYKISDPWYAQCRMGAIEAIKQYSKYAADEIVIKQIETQWLDIWDAALKLSEYSSKYLSVICHRDLWNNNILFRYKDGAVEPDDCVMVDFQAVRCQPPAGDVMLLLYCNLEPNFREQNMSMFLDYYYEELRVVLKDHGTFIDAILTKEELLATAEEQRLWALVVCACLMPQFWVDDELTTKVFSDTAQFSEILSNDKASFIKKMMQENEDYKLNVMNIFEEIVDRYCSGSGINKINE